jgi:hypothetical protein
VDAQHPRRREGRADLVENRLAGALADVGH